MSFTPKDARGGAAAAGGASGDDMVGLSRLEPFRPASDTQVTPVASPVIDGASQRLTMRDQVPASAPPSAFAPEQGDEALVAALRAERPGAVAALFHRYGSHVHRVLVRTLGPDPELSDLVHDVFLAALDDIDNLKEPTKLKSWLASIAVFMARGCIRRRRRWRWIQRELPPPLPDTASAASPELAESVRSATAILNDLPVDERIAFSLRFIEGMKLEEVAEACRTSLATVKRRISRAEKRFLAQARAHPALQDWLRRGGRWSDVSQG